MRIAIVNDVPLAVEAIRRVVVGSRQHQLAWIAPDGAQAVDICAQDTPDLILMDLLMPAMDGVEATRRIMAHNPCPIVIVTADVSGNSSKVFEAMGAGALDAVNTPILDYPGAEKGNQALLAKIETIRKLLGPDDARGSFARPRREPARQPRPHDSLVVIGASAGGPAALAQILAVLPANFPSPIVVVQHVDSQFAQGLANWLNFQTPLRVSLAQEDAQPEPGTVLLAGRDNHLVLTEGGTLAYTPHPQNCAYRPSIDVFFKSVQRFWPGTVLGALLTGMGRDGAEGLQALRIHGHHTIAQDQATSAVYGMPRAATEISAASEVLPLNKIGLRLAYLQSRKTRVHA